MCNIIHSCLKKIDAQDKPKPFKIPIVKKREIKAIKKVFETKMIEESKTSKSKEKEKEKQK